MKYGSVIALLLVVALLTVACAPMVSTSQPTPEPQPTAMPMPAEPAAPTMDIVDTAVSAGTFNTLVTAVQAAGLVDALKGEGPFTVFAPTDDAFATLPQETIDALLADPTGDLTQILLYHVVSGKVMAADLSDGLEAATLQGAPVTFTVSDGGAKVNDANIVAADIAAANGVIHVIDSVILPPADDAVAAPAAAAAAPAEQAAAAAAPAPETMPVTGGEPGNFAGIMLAAGLVLLVIAGVALASRRGLA